MTEVKVNDRVWHRSDAAGAAGTVQGFETVGGQRCALVKWDDESAAMPTPLAALATQDRTASLASTVQAELDRLNRTRGEHNAPMGGWRNAAVKTVADAEGMNPYALDHLIRT